MPAKQKTRAVVCNFMDDQQIFYSPFNSTFNFIMAFIWVAMLTLLAFQAHNIAAIIFIIIVILLAGQIMYSLVKSFLFLVLKKPAIVLTQNYFVDNTSGIKIGWTDVLDLSIYKFNGHTFLAFILVDNSVVYRQVLNPIQNLFLRINATFSKRSFMTNLSFLKGKNADLFEVVNNYYQSRLSEKQSD